MKQIGDETVLFNGHTLHRLYDLARMLINDLVKYLEPYVERNELGVIRLSDEDDSADSGLTRKAYPHVIVMARKLSLLKQGLGEDDPDHSDLSSDVLLKQAQGVALLLQPVRQAAAVLEESCRVHPADLDDGNAIPANVLHRQFWYRTVNTTFRLLRGPPGTSSDHEEAAESCLIACSARELGWARSVNGRAARLHDATTEEITARQLLAQDLDHIDNHHRTDPFARSVPDRHSPQGSRSDVRDHRYQRLENELQSHFTVLNAHLDTLAAMAAEKERKKGDMQGFLSRCGAVLVGVPSLWPLCSRCSIPESSFFAEVSDRSNRPDFSLIVLLFLPYSIPPVPRRGQTLHAIAQSKF